MPRSKNSSGVYRPKYKKKNALLDCLAQRLSTARRGEERIRQGEGRRSRPPKTALERSYLTENSSSENRILRPRREKTTDRIPPQKNDRIYSLYLYLWCAIFAYNLNDRVVSLRTCCHVFCISAWGWCCGVILNGSCTAVSVFPRYCSLQSFR